jgi:hypothetical protein
MFCKQLPIDIAFKQIPELSGQFILNVLNQKNRIDDTFTCLYHGDFVQVRFCRLAQAPGLIPATSFFENPFLKTAVAKYSIQIIPLEDKAQFVA